MFVIAVVDHVESSSFMLGEHHRQGESQPFSALSSCYFDGSDHEMLEASAPVFAWTS